MPMSLRVQLARRWAGLSQAEWDALAGNALWVDPREPEYTMCDYVAFYELDRLFQDAVSDHSARNAKRGS